MNQLPLRRLRVTGESMVPTLVPGDRLLVVQGIGPLRLAVRVGDLVALADPRDGRRIMVKRVVGIAGGGIDVRGDNPAASTDSRHFGPVTPGHLRGRVVYRYHPEARRGRPA